MTSTGKATDEKKGLAERLQQVARFVPGIAAYQDREGLRDTDKKVRVYLADVLAGLCGELDAAQRVLTSAGKLERLSAVDQVARLLKTAEDRVRYASYGFSGVFDSRKMREAELAALHGHDAKLLEAVPRLQERVRAVAAASERTEWFTQAVQAAEAAMREFGKSLDERDRFARGL